MHAGNLVQAAGRGTSLHAPKVCYPSKRQARLALRLLCQPMLALALQMSYHSSSLALAMAALCKGNKGSLAASGLSDTHQVRDVNAEDVLDGLDHAILQLREGRQIICPQYLAVAVDVREVPCRDSSTRF